MIMLSEYIKSLQKLVEEKGDMPTESIDNIKHYCEERSKFDPEIILRFWYSFKNRY